MDLQSYRYDRNIYIRQPPHCEPNWGYAQFRAWQLPDTCSSHRRRHWASDWRMLARDGLERNIDIYRWASVWYVITWIMIESKTTPYCMPRRRSQFKPCSIPCTGTVLPCEEDCCPPRRRIWQGHDLSSCCRYHRAFSAYCSTMAHEYECTIRKFGSR